jgi:hypothetical protein
VELLLNKYNILYIYKMSAVVNRRRNIFINSEQYHQSNGDVNLIFPGADFAVDKNEIMRLSLESFTMSRRFYNININNNTFYIRDKLGTTPHDFSKCEITPGDYTVTTFKVALLAAITDGFGATGATVNISEETRFITIDMSAVASWTADYDFVCFQVPPGRAGTNPDNTVITETGAFNDSSEILGGIPTKDFDSIVSAFSGTASGVLFTSVYPFSLESIEAIHLRTNLQTHSYQTPDFLENSETSSLVPSSIFAKIPIPISQKIQYRDSGSDAYAVDLQNKSLNNIILSLRDDKGRRLPIIENQYKDGNMSFLATLKWCAISKPQIGQVSGYLSDNMQMNLYNY